MKIRSVLFIFTGVFLTLASQVSALESIQENALRSVTGQDGLNAELNYKGTIGRVYLKTSDISFNLNDISIDTDGSSSESQLDRPIKLTIDPYDGYRYGALAIDITEINDLDIVIGSVTVNREGDTDNGASYGGLSLTNIRDNGGTSNLLLLARGADGSEGLGINVTFAETMNVDWAYTDPGSNPNEGGADFGLSSNLSLRNVTSENTIDITEGLNDDTSDIPAGGLHFGFVSLSGDVTLNNIQAGDTSIYQGNMGRIEINNYQLSPESYLVVQGK